MEINSRSKYVQLFSYLLKTNRTTACLTKKDICNIESIIWRSIFSRYVTEFGFEDYCGSSLVRICRYFAS